MFTPTSLCWIWLFFWFAKAKPVIYNPLLQRWTGNDSTGGANFTCPGLAADATTNPTAELLTFEPGSGDFADPRALRYLNLDSPSGGPYYAYASNNYNGQMTNVPLAISTKSVNSGWSWSNDPDMLPAPGAWTTYDPDNPKINPAVDNPFVAEVVSGRLWSQVVG